MMWRRRLSAYAFAVWELELFLDTHPDNRQAMESRTNYRQKMQALKEEYEQKFGPYVCTAADLNGEEHWTWIDDPWPWDMQEGE